MYFDRDSKGFIEIDDFKYAFTEFGMWHEFIRTDAVQLLFNKYVNKNVLREGEVMKYSEYWAMMLPEDWLHRDIAINRMPVYTNYISQNNDESLRKNKELKGYCHRKLKDMLRCMFEVMIWSLKKIDEENNKHGDISCRALSELDTNI